MKDKVKIVLGPTPKKILMKFTLLRDTNFLSESKFIEEALESETIDAV